MSTPERAGAAGSSRQPGKKRSPVKHRGPGLDALLDISQQLSTRDISVLELLDSHRFLTSHQLQQFLFHDHATTISGSRSCRRVLARLESLSLIVRPIRRIGGLQAGSASSIWMLASSGKRLLSVRAGLGATGRVREPGEGFIRHYLAIADTRLLLLQAERAGRLELGSVEIEPVAWRQYLGSGGQSETLKPDLYAVTTVRTGGVLGEFEDSWFIEVDRATESLPTLIRQCQQYESYRRQGIEQQNQGVFPWVLWVVPDEQRANGLRQAISRTSQLDPKLYLVCTAESLLTVILGGGS